MTAALLENPIARVSRRVELSPYEVVLRAAPHGGSALRSPELLVAMAARLGVSIRFDDSGYTAEFTIVAEDDGDAVATAERRWFYLASDLELPTWPTAEIAVRSLCRTHASSW